MGGEGRGGEGRRGEGRGGEERRIGVGGECAYVYVCVRVMLTSQGK